MLKVLIYYVQDCRLVLQNGVLGVLAKSLKKTQEGVCFFSKVTSCRPTAFLKMDFLTGLF